MTLHRLQAGQLSTTQSLCLLGVAYQELCGVHDNGLQFTSAEFQNFVGRNGVSHKSPLASTTHGLMVWLRRLLSAIWKARADNQDPYLNLLEFTNTPIDSIESPSQFLISRRLCTCTPIMAKQFKFKPKVISPKNACTSKDA